MCIAFKYFTNGIIAAFPLARKIYHSDKISLYNWQRKARKQGITAEHPTPKTEKNCGRSIGAAKTTERMK